MATVAVDGATNAALLAVAILALGDDELTAKLATYRPSWRRRPSPADSRVHNTRLDTIAPA